ncbi:MAG: nucleotide exchange factor GrpE, partial [bacterium]
QKTEITEVAQLHDRLLRLQADFDNFRKRTLRERDTWHERAVESVLLTLLPALDNLQLGLRHAVEQKVDETHIKGLRLVVDELQAVLRKFSVTPIETAGQPFDVRWHEALAYLPSTEVAAENVIQEIRAGYRIGEAMLRPAQVIISSGPPPDAAGEPVSHHAPKPSAHKSEG